MTLIVPKRAPALAVMIRNRHRSQRCVAFSASLAKTVLADVSHVGVGIDNPTRTLTFFPSKDVFGGEPAHKLVRDGGGQTPGRCVFFGADALGFIEHVPSGRYSVEVLADRFKIRWQKKDELPRGVLARRKS